MQLINSLKTNIKKHRLMALCVLLILIGGSGMWWWRTQTAAVEPVLTNQQTVASYDDILVSFDSDGSIEYSKVNLRFGVKGTIASILVKEGDEVKQGDIIAKLDDQDYQNQYSTALARLETAQKQKITTKLDNEIKLLALRQELEKLKDEETAMEALASTYATTEIKNLKNQIEAKEKELETLLEKMSLEESDQLSQDHLAVDLAQIDLEETVLYAPSSGRVLKFINKVGERVTDEADFAIIQENNGVKATTNVIEYDIGQIQLGQKVYITAEALSGQRFSGQVSKIASLPETDSSGLVNYVVEIDILDPVPELRDGMNCTANFVMKEVANCIIVPYEAVKMTNGQQIVTVLNNAGQEETRPITGGFSDGTSVEIISGLNAGETVVYSSKQVTRSAN